MVFLYFFRNFETNQPPDDGELTFTRILKTTYFCKHGYYLLDRDYNFIENNVLNY